MNYDIIIIGGGIFGVTTAVTLQQRGWHTAVLDPGPLPHPLAASTDISKVVRMEYGADEQYMEMVEAALVGWRQWNEMFGPLFHEIGVTMFTQQPMAPGGFEYESYQMLLKRGHQPERLDADEISRRFPAWKRGAFVDGFYHAQGGYAESGRVVEALLAQAQQLGVAALTGQTAVEIGQEGGRVTAVRTTEGHTFATDHVLVAAGTWTHLLLPALAPVMKSTGHPVFHLKPAQPELFTPPNFAVFTADVARTGWYGFPLHPTEGVVKIANHGIGLRLHPRDDERVVTAQDEQNFRAFLAATFPALANAPIVYTRRCLYCDTLDEHFWIDRHPEITGLTVAAGGSGHGFKFAPILGDLIADAVEARPNPWLPKFRWRTLAAQTTGEEASRHHG
ncbi:MAG: FAD-dependent oxidoreductase [Anaerolineae bacterium]|nr:FAD-dependent oxidoreductase [Anaerolineae bacterium]